MIIEAFALVCVVAVLIIAPYLIARYRERRREEHLNKIAGRGVTRVAISDRLGRNPTVVPMYSWKPVYNAFIEAGLSPEEAEEETNKRVWLID